MIAAACGGDDGVKPGGPPARTLPASICSPLTYGGTGRPQFLIAFSGAFQGLYKGHGVQSAQAMKLVLAERGWRAGDYTVGLQVCEETSPKTGVSSPEKCTRNGRAFADNRSVMGLIGPFSSGCATHMLPILNRAPGGPLAAISESSYVGLTRSGPGTQSGEPGRYHPTGRRSYARLAPADDVQGAANAVFARRQGGRRAFVLQDGSDYGHGLAATFEGAARAVGLELVGATRWKAGARDYRALAERIRSSRPDTVFVAGDINNNGPRLMGDLARGLGRGVQLMAGDSFNQSEPLVEAAGAAAEGIVISIPVLPNSKLPAPGRRFAAQFEKRFSQRPCCFSVHDAQGTRLLLDAIAQSGGSRERVTEAVMSARVRGGLVGDFEIDRNGDTTLNTEAMYRIREGRLRFETTITPPAALLARE